MASTNMDEHDYAPRPAPPTDKHVLVLLTAYEMFGTDESISARELEQLLSPTLDYWDILDCLDELTDDRWVSVSELNEYYDEYHYFTDEQAETINHRYPNSLDT